MVEKGFPLNLLYQECLDTDTTAIAYATFPFIFWLSAISTAKIRSVSSFHLDRRKSDKAKYVTCSKHCRFA